MSELERRNPCPPASNSDASGQRESAGDLPASILTRCRANDRAAQRQLYEACHRRVFRLAARLVGSQDADDVTQQVFLQVFRRLHQFDGRSRLNRARHELRNQLSILGCDIPQPPGK